MKRLAAGLLVLVAVAVFWYARQPEAPVPEEGSTIPPPAGSAPGAGGSSRAGSGGPALDRPILVNSQGRYFRWSAPVAWSVSETANGVDLSAVDGTTSVSSALLHGGFGSMTPRQFLQMMMPKVNPTLSIGESFRLPDQPGIWGPWHSEDVAMTGTTPAGIPITLRATVGVSQGYGRYSAVLMFHQAPSASWDRDKLWLPAVAQSIVPTNLRELAGQDGVMLPRNNPLDNSGLIETWRQKGLSEDRIAQGQREGTMGYSRMEDPSTGERYDVPLEAYDGTVGGYRNPKRPSELLRKLPPGY
ncbi:MAG: hypothetical protein WD690_06650 [Vicinamibacterales bacterium]